MNIGQFHCDWNSGENPREYFFCLSPYKLCTFYFIFVSDNCYIENLYKQNICEHGLVCIVHFKCWQSDPFCPLSQLVFLHTNG